MIMSLIPVILMVTILSPFSSTQYLVYCPCMGRFGNQAEQFLGSLAFSKSINRTLVLPPWISYSSRPGDQSESCNAKHGSPFGPFWDSFGVNFVTSKMYAPLNFNTNSHNIQRWKEMFPINKYPVVAMTGAPASFPVSEEHVSLQNYIMWTQDWVDKADQWIERNMGGQMDYL